MVLIDDAINIMNDLPHKPNEGKKKKKKRYGKNADWSELNIFSRIIMEELKITFWIGDTYSKFVKKNINIYECFKMMKLDYWDYSLIKNKLNNYYYWVFLW